MREKSPDLLEDIEQSQKKDPVLDGLAKMSAWVVDNKRKTDDAINEVRGEVESVRDEIGKSEAKIEDKLENGFGIVKEHLERLQKRTSALAPFQVQDITDPLLSAMSPDFRKSLSLYEDVAANFPKNSKLAEPVLAAATDRWFKLSTKLQSSKFAAGHSEYADEFRKLQRGFDAITKAGPLTVGTAAEGGNLVPTIVEREIVRIILDAGDVFPRCRRVNMTANTHAFPSQSSGVGVGWIAEEGTLTGTEPAFGQVNLVSKKIAGRATFSIELAEDSNVAVLPYLLNVFGEAIAGELDQEAVEGDGTNFTGINTAVSTNTLAATTATAGDAPTYALLVQAFVKAGEKSTRNNGIWIMHPGVFGNVAGMVDSNGQPILKYGDAAGALPMSIFGRPVIVTNRLATTTVGSDATGQIYFGPPDKLLAGYRSGLRWDVSDAPNWATYRMDCRLVGRFAFAVATEAAWVVVSKVHAD